MQTNRMIIFPTVIKVSEMPTPKHKQQVRQQGLRIVVSERRSKFPSVFKLYSTRAAQCKVYWSRK